MQLLWPLLLCVNPGLNSVGQSATIFLLEQTDAGMSNEVLKLPRYAANADLIDQLETVSQRTTVAALDALLGIVPLTGAGAAAAAAKMAVLSAHVINAAQQLEPTLAVGS